jgi:glycosyltransferase involved in cell wall biosynthesis
MPISLLQAMGAGIPIISTQIGGVADIISNGENGILVPPGDPQSLAEAILRLTDDAVLTKKLAKNGCRRVHTFFSLERMGQEYLKLLMR